MNSDDDDAIDTEVDISISSMKISWKIQIDRFSFVFSNDEIQMTLRKVWKVCSNLLFVELSVSEARMH